MYIHEDGVGYGAEWHHSNTFRYGHICTIAKLVIIRKIYAESKFNVYISFFSSRWYNLTITNPSYDNLGDYLCVAENNGGVMESKVTLTFDDPDNFIDKTSGII